MAEPSRCRTSPCKAALLQQGTFLSALEKLNVFFVERFWDKVRDSRSEVALAIGVSHLRSIEHSLGLSPDAWCLILEQDVVPKPNFKTCILHAAFQLVDNPSYYYTQAVQFCLANMFVELLREARVLRKAGDQSPCQAFVLGHHGSATPAGFHMFFPVLMFVFPLGKHETSLHAQHSCWGTTASPLVAERP